MVLTFGDLSSHGCREQRDGSVSASRQFDRNLTDVKTNGTNKECTEPPIVMQSAVSQPQPLTQRTFASARAS
jgi:hypothetical protein